MGVLHADRVGRVIQRNPEDDLMGRRWIVATLTLVVSAFAPLGQRAESAPLSNTESAIDELGKVVTDQSRPIKERLEMLKALEGWATPEARRHLLVALTDPAAEIRAGAAATLGWPRNNEAVPALRARVEATDETPAVKAAALRALGRIGDPAVRPVVLAATQNPDKAVREAALWNLTFGLLVDPADRTTQLLRLAGDPALDGQLRCDAIRALSGVKEDRVVEGLMQLLEREPRPRIVLPGGQPTQTQLMALRFVQQRDVPAWAANALGQLEARRALELLLRTAEEPNDYFLRLMSLQALVGWNVPEALPLYVRRLGDPLADNRILALMGLMRLGDRTATESVKDRLSDENPEVRAQAVSALVSLEGASSRPVLESLRLREPSPNVLATLDEALAHLPR
jgi:HEAT repeat protein